MSIGAINNPTAFNVYSNYANSMTRLNKSMGLLSRGTKSVADDGAGVAISEQMRSQAQATGVARNNVENSLSMLQTADGWLQQINNILVRMHELSIQAGDASATGSDRGNIQAEFAQLQNQLKDIGDKNAKFNQKNLFSNAFTMAAGATTQIGADSGQTMSITLVDLRSATGTSMGTNNWSTMLDTTSIFLSAGTQASALSGVDRSITRIQEAITFITDTRASLGGQMSRLEQARSGLLTYEDNIRAAESKIRDVDMARESSEMTKHQIQTQVGNAMLAQANQLPNSIVQLLGQ
jgi:flagellin